MAPTQTSFDRGDIALNDQQRRAVEHGDGPLLVVAGAGTGKTRVITERIRHLLETRPDISGENILGLTFTDKSAGEMLSRVRGAVGERAEGISLSTFHAFCMEKILLEADPDLQVLDNVDCWIVLRRNIATLGLKYYKKLARPGEFLSAFRDFFSRCQDELVTPADYQHYVDALRADFERHKDELEPDARALMEEEVEKQEELARVYRISDGLLREKKFVTFGGQLLRAVELLRGDPERLAALRARYSYLLVDEFQDTNIAQIELLWLLAGDRRNIVAVGDHDQAIYRFRGASFGSFTIFLQRFCGVTAQAGAPPSMLVPLTENYRSTQRILRVAGHVIGMNERSPLLPVKELKTPNAQGEKIRIAEFQAIPEEAHWIAGELERLHAARQPWRSFAVLYRQHKHRDALVTVLRQRRIPFVIRNLSILASTLIRDLLAYLRLIAVPMDSVACARVLGIPDWGFQPADLVRLAERARQNHAALGVALEANLNEPPFAKPGTQAEDLVAFLKELRRRAWQVPTTALFEELLAGLGVAPMETDADAWHLKRFAKFIQDWEKKSDGKKLRDFIEYFDFFLEAGGEICQEEDPPDDAVQLMTVHAAKGLEFPHVFVIEMGSKDFPSGQRRPIFEFPAQLMKEEQPQGDFHIQEERRLFYVALTRARRMLTLSTVVNNKKRWSQFLDDILSDAKIQAGDTQRLTPKVIVPPEEDQVGPASADPAQPLLFGPTSAAARVYSRVALWAKAYHPPLPEPLRLSASSIDVYDRCPMKYMFQSVWKISGSAAATMTFGSVMHSTIREFAAEVHKGRRIPFEEVSGIYDREWRSVGYSDDYQEEEYRAAGREQLQAFCAKYVKSPPDVLRQEARFELPLENNVVVNGRIDQINCIKGRKVEIVDYKTGSPLDAKAAKKSLQLSLYALAAREVLELDPVRLVFYNLRSNEAIASERDAKALKKARESVSEVADLIRAGEFPAKVGFFCRDCDYRLLCPAHEQLVSLKSAPRSVKS